MKKAEKGTPNNNNINNKNSSNNIINNNNKSTTTTKLDNCRLPKDKLCHRRIGFNMRWTRSLS
jgi:hypothetical protein